jgi:Uma2 family endonuclease
MAAIPLQRDVYYPEDDGNPMGETEFHRDEIYGLIWALRQHYRDVPDVHVTGDLFLYYVQGDPRSVVCPDVFVVKGVSKEKRRIYKLWEEDAVPFLVVEVTSASTRADDLGKKKDLYERLGVEEYILHDPLGEYLRPQLQGFHLQQGRYRRMEPLADGSLSSRSTGLTFRPQGQEIRLVETATGKPLPTIEETAAQIDHERVARINAEERAQAAEEEIARLRRELERRGC